MATTPTDQNGFPMQDTNLLIARGVYPGIKHVNKFGSNVTAATGVAEDVWDGGGLYTFPDGTADMTHVSQTTDQAALRGGSVTIDGLDTSYNEVLQDVTLDASLTTTAVPLSPPLMRVNRMWLNTAVVPTSTIRLHNTAESVDYVTLLIDHLQTANAIYTIPAGFTGFITGLNFDHIPVAAKDPASVHFHCYARRLGQEWRLLESGGVEKGGGGFRRKPEPYISIPEKTDLRVNCIANEADAHVHASFDIILVDNTK